MTGKPTDGLPWWGKIIYAAIMAPVVVVDTMAEAAKKLKPKKRRPSNDQGD